MTQQDHRTGDVGDPEPQTQHGEQDEGGRRQPTPRPPHGDQDEGEDEDVL